MIAIDGTFASGKGTLARKLSAHYGLPHLDTGKLYRAAAKIHLEAQGDFDDPESCALSAKQVTHDLLDDPILKSGPIGAAASKIAVHPAVRQALFDFQRDFAAKGGVLDGRDIGTIICPDADVKLFIDAAPEERAQRRHDELTGYGEDISFEQVLEQLKERDHRDASRAEAPLKMASDAHLIDTTALSIERAFAASVKVIDAVFAANTAKS